MLNSLWKLQKVLWNIFSSLEKSIINLFCCFNYAQFILFSLFFSFLTMSQPTSRNTSTLKAFVTYLHIQAVRRKWKMSQVYYSEDSVIVRGGGNQECCPGTVDEHSLLIWPQGRGGPPIKIWPLALSILVMEMAKMIISQSEWGSEARHCWQPRKIWLDRGDGTV